MDPSGKQIVAGVGIIGIVIGLWGISSGIRDHKYIRALFGFATILAGIMLCAAAYIGFNGA